MDSRGAVDLETLHMLTIWILLGLFTAANFWWTLLNWRTARTLSNEALSIAAERLRASMLLEKAKDDQVGKPHKVCAECHRIVARYSEADGRVVCPNCELKLARMNG
jgi:uncharacterized paraquat-inducible protein A